MDQIYSQASTIVMYVIGVLTGLLALDHLAYLLAKLSGNKNIETVCTNMAIKLQNIINNAKSIQIQPAQPPVNTSTAATATVTPAPIPPTGSGSSTMSATILLITLLCIGVPTWADTPNTPALSITGGVSSLLNSVDVGSQITKIQNSGLAINTGFWYDWKQAQVDATFTYPVFGSKSIGTWGTWDYINFGYASPDVLIAGTGLDINIGAVTAKWKLPAKVQTILNSTSIGLTPMLGIEKVGSKNRFTGGPGAFVKITF